MNPGLHGMPSRTGPDRGRGGMVRALLAAMAGLSLGACGGGGGGDAAPAAPEATAMSSFTIAADAMPENYRPAGTVRGDLVQAAAARLPADPAGGATYLKVWTDDPATGEPAVLSLGPWQTGQAAARIQVATAATVVHFELYNAAGSVTGEWTP
ncbi:MAG: hypothetical protein RL456_1193 [Pseudomonadota bacterium]